MAWVIAAVAALYFARGILLPFALAALLSFVLSPLVRALERRHVPRVAAVVLVVLLAGGMIGGVGYVMAEQLVQLTAELPGYKQNVREKLDTLREYTDGAVGRMSRTVRELQHELTAGSDAARDASGETSPTEPSSQPRAAAASHDAGNADEPVPVQVVDGPLNLFGLIRDWLGSLLGSLGLAGIVIVLVVFILLEREDLRNRLIALTGQGQLHATTRAIDEATERVSRCLRMQLVINITYGAAVGLGLWAIGLPNAVLWACLGALLRFVPYVGPWIAALMPLSLAVAVGDGWTPVLLSVGLFIALELVTNNVLEPWLYGTSAGISALGIIVSAFIWTWLWGPIGLILATPLTVCLTVVSRYVPQFRFFSILFGDEPALGAQARVYQRLLAVDATEAQQVIDEFLTEHDTADLFDTALLPALAQAERDYCDGFLDDARHSFVLEFIREAIDDAPYGDRGAMERAG